MNKSAWGGVLLALPVLAGIRVLTPARAADNGLPVGTIIAWGGQAASVPAGWKLCNGQAVSKAAYPALFMAIGTSWGTDGVDKFNLPDLRGRFLRGVDGGAKRDPDEKTRKASNPGGNTTGAGTVQDDSLQNHTHDQKPHQHYAHYHINNVLIVQGGSIDHLASSKFSDYGGVESVAKLEGAATYGTRSKLKRGEETRPKNAAVNFIIKVK